MKWREAYRCKKCGKIYTHRQDTYCKKCGCEITFAKPPAFLNHALPAMKFCTENLEPVIIRRRFFKLDIKPSAMPLWLVQGYPPPTNDAQ